MRTKARGGRTPELNRKSVCGSISFGRLAILIHSTRHVEHSLFASKIPDHFPLIFSGPRL